MLDAERLGHAHAIDTQLKSATRSQRRLDHEIARLLHDMDANRLYEAFGCATLREYAERHLELTARQTETFAAIGARLDDLPALAAAFAAGDMPKTKLRELVRVAIAGTEASWLERVADLPIRAVERLVAQCRRGDPPPPADGADTLAPARGRLVFEGATADLEAIVAAIRHRRAETGVSRHDVDDTAILGAICQEALISLPPDHEPENAEPFRIIVQSCPACGEIRSGPAELDDTIALQAPCDALVTDMRPGPTQGRTTRTVPPAVRARTLARDEFRCRVPQCGNRGWLHIHHIHERQDGGGHDDRNVLSLCSTHHRQVHAGFLAIESAGSDALRFTDRLGTRVGRAPSATQWRHADTHVGAQATPA